MLSKIKSLIGPAAVQSTAGQLAEKFGLELRGNASTVVRGVAPIADAKPGQLAFYSTEQNSAAFKILPIDVLKNTRASVILVQPEHVADAPRGATLLITPSPRGNIVKILGEMQINGMYVDKEELVSFGTELKAQIENLKTEIYNLCGEEFNINSTQQLGVVLFEKLKLPVYKKTKSGYSTDVDILEKLKPEHPVIEKILEYRSLMKLNSTYVEGLLPYINEKTHRIHS